jgi:hypothetical protein
MLREKAQKNKIHKLPVGVTKTWRKREGNSPYLEYQVCYVDYENSSKRCVIHFYVGVAPTRKKEKTVRDYAILWRASWKRRYEQHFQHKPLKVL